MRTRIQAVAILLTLFSSLSVLAQAQAVHPKIDITVENLTTGQPIQKHQTVNEGDNVRVTVTTTNGVDCAGQFVVTAVGAPGFPPAVLVQVFPFIIGPGVGSDSATGGTITVGVGTIPEGINDFKISSTYNGAERNQFDTARFEFFVQ